MRLLVGLVVGLLAGLVVGLLVGLIMGLVVGLLFLGLLLKSLKQLPRIASKTKTFHLHITQCT